MKSFDDYAGEAPQDEKPNRNTANASAFDMEAYLTKHNITVDDPHPYPDGTRWTLDQCVLCEKSGPRRAAFFQFSSGAVFYRCLGNTCVTNFGSGNLWSEVRRKFEPGYDPKHDSLAIAAPEPLRIQTLDELEAECEREQEAEVINELFRVGDYGNIIAPPKLGKTYFVFQLVICFVANLPWLGFTFGKAPRKVLLIDNELRRASIVRRLKFIAEKLNVDYESIVKPSVHVVSLRGRQKTVDQIAAELFSVQPGDYGLITCDAMYRMYGDRSENSNSEITDFYNKIESIADSLKAGLLVVHHTSRGDQSQKEITDVGSGAGAQTRATDCHIVLRRHEEDDCYVLEFAVRDFKCPEPRVVRNVWPLWHQDSSLDPSKLRAPGLKPKPTLGHLVEILSQTIDFQLSREDLKKAIKTETGAADRAIDKLITDAKQQGIIALVTGSHNKHFFRLNNPPEVSTNE